MHGDRFTCNENMTLCCLFFEQQWRDCVRCLQFRCVCNQASQWMHGCMVPCNGNMASRCLFCGRQWRGRERCSQLRCAINDFQFSLSVGQSCVCINQTTLNERPCGQSRCDSAPNEGRCISLIDLHVLSLHEACGSCPHGGFDHEHKKSGVTATAQLVH